MGNCHCNDDDIDMEDERNWSEEECPTCGDIFDVGPNDWHVKECPSCRRKRRNATKTNPSETPTPKKD